MTDNLPKIVIGLGFGDEGKGLATSFLCSRTRKPLVVRFNGGHQAGHTVVYNGRRHIFSNFGSGTLQGIPTYWSKYCTFYPLSFLNEYKLLNSYNNLLLPVIYINPLCQVTTPYDVKYNQITENSGNANRHGSVGVGFGATIQRNEDNFKLFVQDLFYEKILIEKLKSIKDYYSDKMRTWDMLDIYIENFIDDISKVRQLIKLANDKILSEYIPVFEGAQGILLDQDFGFFPNVTRSNTTSKNAIEMYQPIINNENCDGADQISIYYITRTYQTRHGNGFMTGNNTLSLKNNENETNKKHEFQGDFRISPLDTELLNYALQCDCNFSKHRKKNLIITCMDQLEIDVDELLRSLIIEFDGVFISRGDSLNDISFFERVNNPN